MDCDQSEERILYSWFTPSISFLRFNVKEATSGKLGSARIGHVEGKFYLLFFFLGSLNMRVSEAPMKRCSLF